MLQSVPRSPRLAVAAVTTLVAVAGVTLTAPAAGAAPADSAGRHPAERVCTATPAPGYATCFALRRTDTGVQPNAATAAPSGYGPADLTSAYQLPSGGAGQTVAVVDAYDDPNAATDLAKYRSTYGLPALASGQFQKVNQNGSTTSLPAANKSWAGEISLDLDMVTAVCPSCNILLVEANSASFSDLGTAVNTAVSLGAKYVSNSYGGPESGNENRYDTAYFNHPGVAITASTGDDGYGAAYPATSQYVTAVGGTSLTRSSTARGWTESVWSGAGAGCSQDVAQPAFQAGVTTGCANRSVADVSAVANPNTGVAVYQTYGGSGWAVYGGTSASAPIIAAVYALAANPGATPNADPYAHPASLYDVTTGNDGNCATTVQCTAGVGYDGPTGLGTPNGTGAFVAGGTVTPTCTSQLLANPGFESGTVGWTASTGVISKRTSAPPHSGKYYARLDGRGTAHTDTLSQSVTIPTGCAASLSFYLQVTTADRTTVAHDILTVQAGGTTIATYSNLSAGSSYVQRTFDVSAYAGSTITISFSGTENKGSATSFLVDDTALTLH